MLTVKVDASTTEVTEDKSKVASTTSKNLSSKKQGKNPPLNGEIRKLIKYINIFIMFVNPSYFLYLSII